jgi:hypothetical protein
MENVLVAVSRLCITAWVGAASLFVVEVISLRASTLFDEATKLSHPKVLFPLFYVFEFWLLGIALGSGLWARAHFVARKPAWRLHLSLVAVALLLAAVDYLWIYQPLARMIELPELPRGFAKYHLYSRWINSTGLVLCGAAAIAAVWPERDGRSRN